jgi:hypothetical protein
MNAYAGKTFVLTKPYFFHSFIYFAFQIRKKTEKEFAFENRKVAASKMNYCNTKFTQPPPNLIN